MPWPMENTTLIQEFYIVPFFINSDYKFLILDIIFFFVIYLTGFLMNIIIVTLICMDPHLHTPMYLFLGNLALVDINYTTITVPNLLYMLLSGNNRITFSQCFIQVYFYLIATCAEVMVIFVMGYDRYVAICHPLYHHSILNKTSCILVVITIWVSASANSILLTTSIIKMFFCSSDIHQFFCDAKALLNISCGGRDMFYIVMYIDCLVFGFSSVICNLISYFRIIRVILDIKSKNGRSKAFSTCSSHLVAMVMYYGSALSVYIIPPSDHTSLLEQILTVFYSTVIPMFNPLIYSLRNKEVKVALLKLLALST